MKSFLEKLREDMMVTGGNPADPQVGNAGNIAGADAPLGFPTPITKYLRGGSGNPYVEKNKREEQ